MGKSYVQDIIISVNPPYTQMIVDGYKRVEYRKQVIKNMRKGDRIYIYETKNKQGSGTIIGFANVSFVFPIHLINVVESETIEQLYNEDMNIYINYAIDNLDGFNLCPSEEYVESIMKLMLHAYYDHVKDNIYHSEKGVEEYFKEIGQGGNYAILFDEFTPCNHVISDFISVKSNKQLQRPPQNMCRVLQRRKHDVL